MKYYFVGLIFFIALGISFYLTIVEKTNTKKLYPFNMKLYFSRADGFKEGDPVNVIGIPIGEIREIKKVSRTDIIDKKFLDLDKDYAIEFTIALKKPIVLWDDYEIKFQTQTVFSGKTIDIRPGGNDNDRKTSVYSAYSDEEPVSNFVPSARYIDDVFIQVNQLIVENKKDLRRFVSSSRLLTDKLNYDKKGTIPQIINTNNMSDALEDTICDIDTVAKEGRRFEEMSREADVIFIPFTINMFRNGARIMNKN